MEDNGRPYFVLTCTHRQLYFNFISPTCAGYTEWEIKVSNHRLVEQMTKMTIFLLNNMRYQVCLALDYCQHYTPWHVYATLPWKNLDTERRRWKLLLKSPIKICMSLKMRLPFITSDSLKQRSLLDSLPFNLRPIIQHLHPPPKYIHKYAFVYIKGVVFSP